MRVFKCAAFSVQGGAGAMKGRGSFLNTEPLNTEHSK
jgi:hypothetical protein